MAPCLKLTAPVRVSVFLLAGFTLGPAQDRDPGTRVTESLLKATHERVGLTFEQRVRLENRTGNTFGNDVDVFTGLFRTRAGLTYTPARWLKVSGMVQDSRSPWYGEGAPSTVRDQADLHEGYIELFPRAVKGFGLTAGRMMLNYGEGRLIGTPQWGNLARTYDQARVHWRFPRIHLEVLVVSPVKIRTGEFNRPVMGDRVWGTYNTLPDLFRHTLLEAYVLHRDQNRAGGFTAGSSRDGTDRLGINSFGFRLAGPLASGLKYSLEAILQNGSVGPAELKACAGYLSLSRRWSLGTRTLDLTGEYKYASGTKTPSDARHSGTFDQLYAANHDKFGHEDLFGWRNIHNVRSLATLGVTKQFGINFQYDNYWLASVKDAIYNGAGRSIARSPTGLAGRHVGQEADLYGTYKHGHFTFGAGYGRFFSGQFVRNTTPGISPTYLYVFQAYAL